MPAVELLQSLGRPGGVRALLVHGSNLVVSSPNVEAVRAGIAALDLLVVCDFFLSETAALADVVLPITQWAEEEGTMTSLEGRVIRRRRAITPPSGVRDELWILAELARRLECTAAFDTDPELVFEELRLASEGGIADYSGIDYAMLDRGEAAYWPYPRGSAGTPRLFADRFAHPDGSARLVAVSVRSAARPQPAEGELTLITGRLLEHYQSGAQTRRVAELAEAQPEALASMHPATAERLGIADGDDLELANSRGTVRCRARLSTDIRTRRRLPAVPLRRPAGREPAHLRRRRPRLGDARVQDERGPHRARRRPAAPHPPHGSRSPRMTALRIVLVGYGPVGARFVEELLPAVRRGVVELTVVAGEAVEAYNRVLVAEYAVGNTELDAMLVGDRATRGGGRCTCPPRCRGHLDRPRRPHRATQHGRGAPLRPSRARHGIASERAHTRRRRAAPPRPRLAREVRARRSSATTTRCPEGITALRDLADAERVLGAVRARRRIIVLGAGVLGLELALAAAHAGAQVCVVHHGPHPMPRNLDRGGGQVLRAALRRSGVTVIAHSRAEAVGYRTDHDGTRRFDMLVTADGKQLRGDLLVLSCGVSPRNELATLAGLRTAVGVVVHPDLRSWTDPDVYAIGDCAQVVERTDDLASRRVLPGSPSGLVGPGWRQADWLAAALTTEADGAAADGSDRNAASDRPAAGIPAEREPIVMLKAEHLDVVAVGDVSADPWDDDALSPRRRVSQWADPEHLRYVKMVTDDGTLTGFVCVGMPRTGAELTLLFERRGELPADRSLLLRFDGPDYDPAEDADAFAPTSTVCWCNGVTVGRIEESAACGNTTVECVGRDTRAGTGCGGCKGRIADLLARAAEADGTPTLTP